MKKSGLEHVQRGYSGYSIILRLAALSAGMDLN